MLLLSVRSGSCSGRETGRGRRAPEVVGVAVVGAPQEAPALAATANRSAEGGTLDGPAGLGGRGGGSGMDVARLAAGGGLEGVRESLDGVLEGS